MVTVYIFITLVYSMCIFVYIRMYIQPFQQQLLYIAHIKSNNTNMIDTKKKKKYCCKYTTVNVVKLQLYKDMEKIQNSVQKHKKKKKTIEQACVDNQQLYEQVAAWYMKEELRDSYTRFSQKKVYIMFILVYIFIIFYRNFFFRHYNLY